MRSGLIQASIIIIDKIIEMNIEITTLATLYDPINKKLVFDFMDGKLGEREYEATQKVLTEYLKLVGDSYSHSTRVKERVKKRAMTTKEIFGFYLQRLDFDISLKPILEGYLLDFYERGKVRYYLDLFYSDKTVYSKDLAVMKELLEIHEHERASKTNC